LVKNELDKNFRLIENADASTMPGDGRDASFTAARACSNKQLILTSERFFETICRIVYVSEGGVARVLARPATNFNGERLLRLIGYTSISLPLDLAR
jgi:hypothetical protein